MKPIYKEMVVIPNIEKKQKNKEKFMPSLFNINEKKNPKIKGTVQSSKLYTIKEDYVYGVRKNNYSSIDYLCDLFELIVLK